MATISHVTTAEARGVTKTLWETVTNGDTGDWEDVHAGDSITVQVLGTFGTGGTIVIEGSNDGGTTNHTLSDLGGTDISVTAADTLGVNETPLKIRPNCTGGDATTDLDVHMVVTRDS